MTAATAETTAPATADRLLQRRLGVMGLTAVGFSNIVGSGWLFSALYTAQTAGPAAIVAWVAAGVLCAIIALVMVDLGATRPEAGGTVRWPQLANGRLVGSVIGVSVLLTVGATAAEISAIMGYARHYLPWLQHGTHLTAAGFGIALALAVVLSALNWFGVRLFASVNNVVTAVKVVVPLLTVAALFASGFHASHLTDHGGFAPYGWSAVLSSLAVGGVVYSVNGFQAAADFSGEARDARRDVPRAILLGIGLAVLVYLLLQVAFLFAVPNSMLTHGWAGVNFDSPFAQLALILDLQWLAVLLYADAVVSPSGSAFVGVAVDTRHSFALAKNGVLPGVFRAVEQRSGIPRRAVALNLVVIALFLLPFGGWQDIVSVVGDLYLLTYVAVAVAAVVLLDPSRPRLIRWLPPTTVLAPVAFVVGGEFVYWSGWHDLRIALSLTLLGVPLYLFARRRLPAHSLAVELRRGGWVVVFVGGTLLLSWLGSFGGRDWIPAPWDSFALAVLAVAVFADAVRQGRRLVAERASEDGPISGSGADG